MFKRVLIVLVFANATLSILMAEGQRAKDNGDIYVVNVTKLLQGKQQQQYPPINATIVVGVFGEVNTDIYDDDDSIGNNESDSDSNDTEDEKQKHQQKQQDEKEEAHATSMSEAAAAAESMANLDEIVSQCNSSFSLPMESLVEFNSTGALTDEVDKTGLCFIRCFYEKAGLIKNWQLNSQMIRDYMWPATGDSIEFCQSQGKNEKNPCVRTYYIAKCLMLRAIVDARNKPVV